MNQKELFYTAFREACISMSRIAQPANTHSQQALSRIKSKLDTHFSEGLTEQEIREKIKVLQAGICRSIAFCGTTYFCKNRIARVRKLQHYLDTRCK